MLIKFFLVLAFMVYASGQCFNIDIETVTVSMPTTWQNNSANVLLCKMAFNDKSKSQNYHCQPLFSHVFVWTFQFEDSHAIVWLLVKYLPKLRRLCDRCELYLSPPPLYLSVRLCGIFHHRTTMTVGHYWQMCVIFYLTIMWNRYRWNMLHLR